jgi:ABC-type glycerol-3-phosphate transport system substrate-binding protein
LRKRFLLFPCLLILSALALAACGSSSGGDEGEIEEVIQASATTNDPADCKKLNTQKFMEQTTQESGDAAVKQCEDEAKEEEGSKSVKVSAVEVDGSDATAEAALSGGNLDGQTLEVALVKDGDQWKMNEVVEFTKFDQAKLVEGLEGSLEEAASEVNPKFASCVIEAFKQGSQSEVEDLLFGQSPQALEEVFESCSSNRSA